MGELSEEEQQTYEDIIVRGSQYKFDTVDYDNELFRAYVIDEKDKAELNNEKTGSQKLII